MFPPIRTHPVTIRLVDPIIDVVSVVPLAAVADRYGQLTSWDRFIIHSLPIQPN